MNVQFGSGGWVQWPDSEEFSIEFMRLLGAAQEGGSMISECFLAASRIDPKDGGDSWYREWMRMADLSNERANAAFTSGHVLTAQSNWLRAINYYQASAFGLDAADTKQERALRTMRGCAHSYIEHRSSRFPGWKAMRWRAIFCLPPPPFIKRLSSCVWATPDIGRKNISSRWRAMPATGEWRCSPWICLDPAPASSSVK